MLDIFIQKLKEELQDKKIFELVKADILLKTYLQRLIRKEITEDLAK